MGLFSKVVKPIKSILNPIGGTVGSALNELTGVSDSDRRAFATATALADKEYENNVSLWNLQNEYNTPAAQMARMAEAGIDLNPMTYAVGNGNMSTTASSISAPGTHMSSGSSAGNPIAMLMSTMHGIKDLELKQKEIDNYETIHQPAWLQIAKGFGEALGVPISNFTDVIRVLKNKLPSFGGSSVSKDSIEELNRKNKVWWKGEQARRAIKAEAERLVDGMFSKKK